MLMPSAISCESHAPVTRLRSALFASPPASPPSSADNSSTFGNIFSSCRALQSMLTAPATILPDESPLPASRRDLLPTPPMAHTALPPLKLRLRSRKTEAANANSNGEVIKRKKVVKRAAPPPRGVNKRRRAIDDDLGRDDEDTDSDLEISNCSNNAQDQDAEEPIIQPSTPKRARIAPEVIPLGLERNDFHSLHTSNGNGGNQGTWVEVEADGEKWSKEDDRILVELVLEKLKLSKTDWQDCARSLGKDRSSIGRRWKTLMRNEDVGLKSTRSRRTKIHGTWR